MRRLLPLVLLDLVVTVVLFFGEPRSWELLLKTVTMYAATFLAGLLLTDGLLFLVRVARGMASRTWRWYRRPRATVARRSLLSRAWVWRAG